MTDWAQVFGDRLSAFKELQDAPWGRLRYSVGLANLQRHLGGQPLRILDAKTIFAYTFGVPVQAYVAEDLYQSLEQAGCSVIGRYGVRCVNDYIFDNSLKADPAFFARLERLELALTDRYPYYLLARFFQLIARKKAGV